ncbi:UNKNOWN [Stylonychia lemnae]|uniref:SAM domain-containing protein n=1 Tax=Stylonychia lemnae TaxID=5949 RepID=A0A078B5W3_STYLE|nr:UNKNOWN [Stylonychia lemnae]|eukprot:CDW89814.1 UNKNOWN [Stylonychia lemnae]
MSVQSNQTFMNSNGFNNALKEHTENVLSQIKEVNEKYRQDCRDHLSESTIKSSIYQKVKNDSQMQFDLTEEKDNRRLNTTNKKDYQGQRQVLIPQDSYIITTAGPSPQQSFVEYALCSFGDTTITPQMDFQVKSSHQNSKQAYSKSMIDRILECLDLKKYQRVFKDQEVNNLNDFVLLEKQDLVELGIPIGARNRIVAFNQYYQNNGSLIDFNTFQLDDLICLKTNSKQTKQTNPAETLT